MVGAAEVSYPAEHRREAPSNRPSNWGGGDESIESITFGLASDTDTLDAAYQLVHDQYVSRGYMDPHPSGRRLSLHNALPTTKVFVARKDEDVLGTVSVIQDSVLGLPMDEIYQDELVRLRRAQRGIAEVSALAIRSECRALGLPILMRLVRMIVVYTAEVARLDDLCIAVNPRHVSFYQKALSFTMFGPLRGYQKVNGAPAVAMHCDLGFVRQLMAETARRGTVTNDLCGFLFAPETYAELTSALRDDLPWSVLTPQQFHHFFAGHESLTQASPRALSFVRSVYSGMTARRPAAEMAHSLPR
jgi:hypothetical protein